jgi:hypothetical protein
MSIPVRARRQRGLVGVAMQLGPETESSCSRTIALLRGLHVPDACGAESNIEWCECLGVEV